MAVLPIRTFPDPGLKVSTPFVSHLTPKIVRMIDELIETMRAHPRCVGLAAPQVGWNARIAVADATGHPKAAKTHGLVVLINPRILAQDGQAIQREGCLSVPDLTGNVPRAARLRVQALDASGATWTQWFDGFEAIVMQHEIDHLDGKLFLDRVANLKSDVFRRKTYWFPTNRPERLK